MLAKKTKNETVNTIKSNTKSGSMKAKTDANNKPSTKKPATIKKTDTKTPLKKRTVKRTSSGSSLTSVNSTNNENNNKKVTKKTKTEKSPPKSSAPTKKNKTGAEVVQTKKAKTTTSDDAEKTNLDEEMPLVEKNQPIHPEPTSMEIGDQQEKPVVQTAVSVTKNLTSKPPRPAHSNTNKKQALPDTMSRKELVSIRPQDSMNLYKNGWGPPGQGLVVTKSSTEQVLETNKQGRPIFQLPLNLNDSTASFQGNSPSYLEMSSGLVPYHPQNKYNFRISLDETHDMSQTAFMLKNFIFDENDLWDTNRTESSHLQKYETSTTNGLNLPDGYDERDDSSVIIPSTDCLLYTSPSPRDS